MDSLKDNKNKMSELSEEQTGGKKLAEPKPALNFLLMGAGSVFTSMVVAGFLVGYVFDELFDTKPLFMLVCGVMGFVGGAMNVHKLLGKMDLMYEDSSAKTDTKEKK